MSTTPIVALPLLAAAQAQKHVTMNEALLLIDALLQLAVQETDRNQPPDAPRAGDRYVIGATPSGGFSGKAGMLAAFDGFQWNFISLSAGSVIYSAKDKKLFLFDGSALKPLHDFIDKPDSLVQLGVGTGPDPNNVLSVKGSAALFAATAQNEGGSGSFRFVLNKANAASVLSQLYQTGWSGRAETGLTGDDAYRIKTSPNGTLWFDALVADPNNGTVSLPSGLAHIGGGALSYRNLIINSEASIAQRGAGPFTLTGAGALPCFDRWRLVGSAATTASLSRMMTSVTDASLLQARSFLNWSVTAATSSNMAILETRLDQMIALAERRVTLSFRYKANATFSVSLIRHFGAGGSSPASIALGNYPAASAWRFASISTVLPSLTSSTMGSDPFLTLRFAMAQPGQMQLADVQLEEGFRSPYERRPPSYELLLCRYFFRRSQTALNLTDLTLEMRTNPRQSGNGPFDYDCEFEAIS